MSQFLADAAATGAFARQIHRLLPEDTSGWTVLLEGELGAGKSTFARALIIAMGHTGPVPSPTYTLVEPYQLSDKIVYHIDLYRIAGAQELRYLGWTEFDDGLRLVEWPDRLPALADQSDLRITLVYQGEGRRADIEGLSERGIRVLSQAAFDE